MASKKNKAAAKSSGNVQALRIGSRVRCNDDGVEGRIVWANAVAVKIEWDDGEKVTWKRDSLATRPIVILDPDDMQPEAPATEEAGTTEQVQETPEAPAAEPTTEEASAEQATTPAATEAITWNVLNASPGSEDYRKVIGTVTAETLGDAQAAAKEQYPAPHIVMAPEPPAGEALPTTPAATEPVPAKPKRQRKAPAESKEKKLSALDAAAKVLAEEGRPMTTKEMIGAMAIKGYWTSPGGKTPDATLYSAILREITTKGEQSRFVKSGPGHFARRANA
jgi:hypothetical protein